MKTIRAWHFLREDKTLGYGDTRKPRPGRWLVHRGKLELCRSGLHGSTQPLDSLEWAPGLIVCRVELGGETIIGDDKIVAARRRIIWWADATDVLRRFARLCALDVIHLWDAPDVVKTYLRSGDEQFRDAAWDAAWDAGDAARDAARDAVAAARAAARASTRAAVDAARAAARAAAWDAARAAQNRRLARMLNRLHGDNESTQPEPGKEEG